MRLLEEYVGMVLKSFWELIKNWSELGKKCLPHFEISCPV
jgi:hypothetical protein